MDNEFYDFRDDSRPFFQRKKCEVGIYISIYDAIAIDSKSFGLEHFFFMKTTELMYNECRNTDLVKIRAALVQRGVLKDCYVERFEPGIVLAIGFDRLDSLDELWSLHRKHKLQPLMQDMLITPALLKTVSCRIITLDVKLWDDEYEDCRRELLNRMTKPENIRDKPTDMRMVQRLKDYQKVLGQEVQVMRDLENDLDLKRAEFTAAVHRILPETQTTIKTLKEFGALIKSAKASKLYNRQVVDQYLQVIQKWRNYFQTFDIEITTPLLQIHRSCENAEQREIKDKILKHIQDMQRDLKRDNNLLLIAHPEMERKIARREAPLFLGLLSLVPMGADKVADIDIFIDDYMRHYKFEEET